MPYLVRKLLCSESDPSLNPSVLLEVQNPCDVTVKFMMSQFATKNGDLSTWYINDDLKTELDEVLLVLAMDFPRKGPLAVMLIDTETLPATSPYDQTGSPRVNINYPEGCFMPTHRNIRHERVRDLLTFMRYFGEIYSQKSYIREYDFTEIKRIVRTAEQQQRLKLDAPDEKGSRWKKYLQQ